MQELKKNRILSFSCRVSYTLLHVPACVISMNIAGGMTTAEKLSEGLVSKLWENVGRYICQTHNEKLMIITGRNS